jgi:phage baseplate assembly protein W
MAVIQRRDTLTSLKKQPVVYSDFPTSFAVQPQSKDLVQLTDDRAIVQSLYNLVKTARGERPFQYNFGCDVHKMLFEDVSPITAQAIKNMIESAIKNFEPRVKVIEIVVSADPDNAAYGVTLTFSIINRPDPISLDLILERVR